MARIHKITVQKCLNDLDNHDALVTDLEPDIHDCEVKCDFGSITLDEGSESDRGYIKI